LESKGSIQALIEGHSEGYENIRKAFGERMRLEGPRNYWEAASRGHLRRSVVWLTAFLSLAFVSLAGIVYLAVRLKDVVAYLGTALGPFEWFVIGVPTVIVLWVVRSAHRQWMTHSGLANDAMERVTMVETYLALTNEGKISSVERPLVLNPLFRPSSVKADDGMPGGMLDHIIEVLNKTKSGG
jgi:hypothetical protein